MYLLGPKDDKGWVRVRLDRAGMSYSGVVPFAYVQRPAGAAGGAAGPQSAGSLDSLVSPRQPLHK